MQKGQVILEFLFIIIIVIVYLSTAIFPLSAQAQLAVNDTASLARASNEAQKLINTVYQVSSMGEGSRLTLTLFVPENSTIRCGDTNVSFITNLKLKPYPQGCSSGYCLKEYYPPKNTLINCVLGSLTGPTTQKVKVEKNSGKVLIDATS